MTKLGDPKIQVVTLAISVLLLVVSVVRVAMLPHTF